MKKILVFLFLVCLVIPPVFGFGCPMIRVCFTPGGDCTGLIVSQIESARSEVLVQAYYFTSAPVAKALVNAAKRGVHVEAILDKSQESEKYSSAKFLVHMGIPVLIDYKPAIAHNKIIIIDRQTVITGSFNFTKAAQNKNAENLLVIQNDPDLVRQYFDNYMSRRSLSIPYHSYQKNVERK